MQLLPTFSYAETTLMISRISKTSITWNVFTVAEQVSLNGEIREMAQGEDYRAMNKIILVILAFINFVAEYARYHKVRRIDAL